MLELEFRECIHSFGRSFLLLLAFTARAVAASTDINPDNTLVSLSSEVARSDRSGIGSVEFIPTGLDSHLVLNDRGNARLAQRDFRGAVTDYTRALEISPGYATAYVNRANARNQLGDVGSAIADCNRALALSPKYVEALIIRGGIHEKTGDLSAALVDLNRAVSLAPKHIFGLMTRTNVRAVAGDFDGALADAEQAAAVNPKSAWPYNRRGRAKYLKGDLIGALGRRGCGNPDRSDKRRSFS